jgi:tRNA pseudouridine55 synthase
MIPGKMLNCNDGIILVDKNEGETSFDVVRKAKRAFKKKKVGHAGTLDPFATGLLIILLGQGTKLSDYLMSGEKKYVATMTLGIGTDTLDRTGRTVRTMAVPDIDQEEIRRAVQEFTGDIEQRPPAYSAININGRRAYELARKGIAVDLKKRIVTIRSIDIISVNLPDITFEVTCSGGTYIRSLAADIAERIGSAGHLKSLRRLSSGGFDVRHAMDSKMIGDIVEGCNLTGRIISLKDALPDMRECSIDHVMSKKIANGIRPGLDELKSRDPSLAHYKGFIKMTEGSSLVAVMEVDCPLHDDKAWLKNIRIFT